MLAKEIPVKGTMISLYKQPSFPCRQWTGFSSASQQRISHMGKGQGLLRCLNKNLLECITRNGTVASVVSFFISVDSCSTQCQLKCSYGHPLQSHPDQNVFLIRSHKAKLPECIGWGKKNPMWRTRKEWDLRNQSSCFLPVLLACIWLPVNGGNQSTDH